MENFESQPFQQDPMGNPNFMKSNLPNATAVLVLGIISIVGCCCYGIVGIICGAIGLVLAKKDLALYKQNPNAYNNYSNLNTGRILCIIGLILSIIYLVYMIVLFTTLGMDGIQDMQKDWIEKMQNR